MKKIVTTYSGSDWSDKIPFKSSDESFRLSYEQLYIEAQQHGAKFYRASIDWYDTEKSIFKKYWTFENGKWEKINKPIIPDVIFDKVPGRENNKYLEKKLTIAKKFPTLNNPLFRDLTDSKLSQQVLLGEFMPKTFVANSKQELISLSKKIKTSKVVLKPLFGSGGFGIHIIKKSDVSKKNVDFPILIQEFVTNPGSVRNVTKKGEVADLRLILIDHKLIYALSRIAKKGSLMTNFHQGATTINIPISKIPKPVLAQAKKIKEKLSIFQKNYYSLDFMFDKRGNPILIEMNTVPGIVFLALLGNKSLRKRHMVAMLTSLGIYKAK